MTTKLSQDCLAGPVLENTSSSSSSSPGQTHRLYTPEPAATAANAANAANAADAAGSAAASDGAAAAVRPSPAAPPLVICFHGSGESCSPAWDGLARALAAAGLRALTFDRGPAPGPAPAAQLQAYLAAGGLETAPPYVLVAHSYGGAFARAFLDGEDRGAAAEGAEEEEEEEGEGGDKKSGKERKRGKKKGKQTVAGLVLVETGQEGGLDRALEERQYAGRALGRRPLSVVRGNSLLRMTAPAGGGSKTMSEAEREVQRRKEEMMRAWDQEDERLKRRQLELSLPTAPKRYVHLPDCGHDVVRERPDVVVGEVVWVVGNIGMGVEDGEDEEDKEPECKLDVRLIANAVA
ncbi:Alpha/Beta hydrolase protein [Hypoxylon sp. FL1284]|nr:Alpha/Beta hydrolase protein [Hypoxylon sp. FL1284]